MSQKASVMLIFAVCACIVPCISNSQAAPENQTLTAKPGQAITLKPGETTVITTPPAAQQNDATPPGPTPAELYKQAMRPLDQVRSSLENWSDAELGALAAGITKAREACAQMKPELYHGDALYDLAHLCAFGQDWAASGNAAEIYIARGETTHRTQAYALSVNALVHQNAIDMAVKSAEWMLKNLPYDAEVAFTVRYLKDTLEQANNPLTLKLAAEEHAQITQALKQGVPLKAANSDAVMDIGSLYDSAMELAFLQWYAQQNSASAATAEDCHAALPDLSTLTPEDREHIENVHRQYQLLGQHLPNITVSRALISATAKPQLPHSFGEGTVLVLFPDWCAQCRNMLKTMGEFNKVNAATPLYAYGLAFVDTSLIDDKSVHDAFVKQMQGTPTYIVPPSTAQSFGALEFPLAIVADRTGTIRFVGTIPGDAFKGGGYIEKLIQRSRCWNTSAPCVMLTD